MKTHLLVLGNIEFNVPEHEGMTIVHEVTHAIEVDSVDEGEEIGAAYLNVGGDSYMITDRTKSKDILWTTEAVGELIKYKI